VPEKAAQPPVRRKDHRPVAVVVQLLAADCRRRRVRGVRPNPSVGDGAYARRKGNDVNTMCMYRLCFEFLTN
jgi:hypothetical protein